MATHIVCSPQSWADLSKSKQATDSNMSLVGAGTGVDPPAEWTALRGRFNDYLHLESRVAAQLAKAVVSGAGPTEIASLRAGALAVATAMPSGRRRGGRRGRKGGAAM